jgi:hypothetical protein
MKLPRSSDKKPVLKFLQAHWKVQKTLAGPGWLASFFLKATCSYDTEKSSWGIPLIDCKDLINTLSNQGSKERLLKLI